MATAGVQVFVTMDRNLMYQQNLIQVAQTGITVVVLRARSNRLTDLLPLVLELQATLDTRQQGQIVHLGVSR